MPDGIDSVGDSNFDAVFFDGAANPQPNDIADVGLMSPYGTAGQGGNVWELEETDFDLVNDSGASARGFRGGSWDFNVSNLLSSFRDDSSTTAGFSIIGFRVASAIPEPSTLLLAASAGVGLLWRRRSLYAS
jgi:hypothetical protein